jgi:hypothetical protein
MSRYARVDAGQSQYGVVCGVATSIGQYSDATIVSSIDIRAFCTWED